jgi:hypothetical protein
MEFRHSRRRRNDFFVASSSLGFNRAVFVFGAE